jgi:hypothetical protein
VGASASASDSGIAEGTGPVQESADPLFAICGTSLRGNSTLPGLNVTQSLNQVLFDNSSESQLIGDAAFDIIFSSSNATQLNGPGYDIAVSELGSPERFQISLIGSARALQYAPAPTQYRNECGKIINAAGIDLDAFGIDNDTSIRGLRIDNLGKPGCCAGADIADVYLMNMLSNVDFKIENVVSSNTSKLEQWSLPLMIPMPSKQ